MADALPDWLADVPPKSREPLARCAAGLPANVALMLLLMQCADAMEAESALVTALDRLDRHGDHARAGRLGAALKLLRANPQAPEIVRSILSGLDHQREGSAGDPELAYWASAFDRAARESPEASVALYSLGNPQLLEAATAEIVDRLVEWGLISPDTECLDVGCGIGRFELVLASLVRRIVGIDISEVMVATARERCASLPNVEIRPTSGRDLSGFTDRSFDLVLAVDSFPYIVQSGPALTQAMLLECARVLRPGGDFIILNFSYRGDLERDWTDLQAFAACQRLEMVRNGTDEFKLWDGAALVLKKP